LDRVGEQKYEENEPVSVYKHRLLRDERVLGRVGWKYYTRDHCDVNRDEKIDEDGADPPGHPHGNVVYANQFQVFLLLR
jgi:hypothetical protein